MYQTSRSAQIPPVEVEAILVRMTDHDLSIMTDERARPVSLKRSGVKVAFSGKQSSHGAHVTLTLSERKAINAGLV